MKKPYRSFWMVALAVSVMLSAGACFHSTVDGFAHPFYNNAAPVAVAPVCRPVVVPVCAPVVVPVVPVYSTWPGSCWYGPRTSVSFSYGWGRGCW